MDREDKFIPQAAAIAMLDGRVCLITSRSGKRWVVPKGVIEPGSTAGETALLEAWEEAGLVGQLVGEPLGSYLYRKWSATCHVTVFVMQVTNEAVNWPEAAARTKAWLDPEEAATRVAEPELRDLILATAGQLSIP